MELHPDRALADVAAAQHGVFTRKNARQAGLSETEVRLRVERHWIRLHDGVFRAAGAPPTWRGALRAATLAAGTGSAISHRSLAALHELPGGREDLTELTCVRWKRTLQADLVVHESRRLHETDIEILDGIPVTRPERLIIDMASIRPYADYLETLIQAARRKRLITYASTRAMFDRHARRGLKGVAVLRGVLDEWDPESQVTDSDMETLLLQTLRDHGLPEPALQYEVRDALGNLVGRADAAYPSHRIAIEYDSMQEHSDEFQLERDARRRNAFQALGYAILSARHAHLIAGGGELCAQIGSIMRRTA
jgi:very-short-patch-repair endonuclease